MPSEEYIFICPTCFAEYPSDVGICERDQTPLRRLQLSIEDPLIGRLIDKRYMIETKIGQGGMGSVYRAQQISVDRKVAIKTMHASSTRGEEYITRFLREANMASSVSHPNLISIYDFGQTKDGILYIVMEFMQGLSLAERLRSHKPLTLEHACNIAIQMCAALAAAHSANIVHRDLKPDNIYLIDMPGGDLFIKLLDFGIAKNLDAGGAMTQTGQVFGTPEYMSPEQCRGDSKIDARADLYALGCIFYELLCGHTPYNNDSMLKVLFDHVSAPIPKLVASTYELQALEYEPLLQLIYKLLHKEPGQRPMSALSLRDSLETICHNLSSPTLLLPAWHKLTDEQRHHTLNETPLSLMHTQQLVQGVAPTPNIRELPGAAIAQTLDIKDESSTHTHIPNSFEPQDSYDAFYPDSDITPKDIPVIPEPHTSTPQKDIASTDTDPPDDFDISHVHEKNGSSHRIFIFIAIMVMMLGGPALALTIHTITSTPVPPSPQKINTAHTTPKLLVEPDAAQAEPEPPHTTPDMPFDLGKHTVPEVTSLSETTSRTKKKRKKRKKRKTQSTELSIRSSKSVDRHLRSKIIPRARACFSIAYTRNPNIVPQNTSRTKMVYKYAINPSGKVTGIFIVRQRSTVFTTQLDTCIKQIFAKTKFLENPLLLRDEHFEATFTFTYGIDP